MIYVITMPDKYVTGVIRGTREMSIFLSLIPNNLLSKLEVEPVHPRNYPFQLLEIKTKDNRRLFLAAHGDKDMKMLISTTECLENTPLAIYTINEDYVGNPEAPGTDYMGMLPHKLLQED